MVWVAFMAGAAWATGFDFPLGPPDRVGYGVAGLGGLEFLERYDYGGSCGPTYHPGEDWNADGSGLDAGGDGNDAGDPVYAAADGEVAFVGFLGKYWGYVVLIRHVGTFMLPTGEEVAEVWSQYGHLAQVAENPETGLVWRPGEAVGRRLQLGTVGDYPHGSAEAFHLHFEIRSTDLPAGSFPCRLPREEVAKRYVSPTAFIERNRPAPATDSASVSGFVRELNGTVVENATVVAFNVDDLDVFAIVQSGNDGSYELTIPAPGTYGLQAIKPPAFSLEVLLTVQPGDVVTQDIVVFVPVPI